MNQTSKFWICLTLVVMGSCSRQAREEKSADDSVAVANVPEMVVDSTNISKPIANLENADTLYNVLARQKLLEGELVGVTLMTESFVDINKTGKKRALLAALIETGVGEYTGSRDGTHETTHAVLAVFELKDDSYSLVTQANVGEGGGYGLKLFTTSGETVSLMAGGEAVMVHSKSSESGAGDYGFRKDDVSIYILLNNSITSVFEATLEDYQFSSDEQTATSEQTITSEINVLDSTTKGLYDIRRFTTTVLSGTTDQDNARPDEEATDESPDQEPTPDPGQLYTWDGTHYQPQPD